MPNYRGHLTGAFIFYCIIIGVFSFYTYSFITLIEWFLCTLLGALFPDIDTKSKGQKLFYRILFVMIAIFFVQQKLRLIALFAFIACIPLITRHRGVLHNFWAILSLIILLLVVTYYFVPNYFMLIAWDLFFFMMGVISHLWLDLGFMRMIRL